MRPTIAVFAALTAAACAPAGGETAPPLSLVAAAPTSSVAAQPEAEATTLYGLRREAWVHDMPSDQSARRGYVGPGGRVVGHGTQPGPGCHRGWYALKTGFICADDVTADASHVVAKLFSEPADLGDLPYRYARSRYPTPMRYARLPSSAEQKRHESDLRKHLRKARPDETPTAPTPDFLANGDFLPSLEGPPRTGVLALGRARRRSGYALLATYEHDGRLFGLTREPAFVPIDRTFEVSPSKLRGARLGDVDLPIAIVTSERAHRHRVSGSKLRSGDPLDRYTVVALSQGRRKSGGHTYLETDTGDFVRASQVTVINRFRQAPVWARRGDKWLDISILDQTLVAYEGEKPVFATLVSTGADGIADHNKTHATVVGTFLIHTKHLTTTMNSDAKGESFDLRDVPFVQYFTEGYALHAAYWHDDFGRPRSHGCVNLSPQDAAWLFAWTGPELPDGWHGALSDSGTLVHIHP